METTRAHQHSYTLPSTLNLKSTNFLTYFICGEVIKHWSGIWRPTSIPTIHGHTFWWKSSGSYIFIYFPCFILFIAKYLSKLKIIPKRKYFKILLLVALWSNIWEHHSKVEFGTKLCTKIPHILVGTDISLFPICQLIYTWLVL